MNTRAKMLIAAVLLAAIAGVYGYRLYHKSHQDAAAGKADAVLLASELLTAFEQNENAANALYLNKLIEVKGEVQEIQPADPGVVVFLREPGAMSGVSCAFETPQELKVGQNVTVRGFCTGMLMDVSLSRCSLMK